jgi:hypothetical protein
MYATNSTVTNFVATNASVATLNLSTGVTAASAQFTNANVTTITAGGLFVTNGNIALSKNGSTNNNSITFTNNYDTMFVGMDGVGLTGAASQGTLFTYKTPITFHPGASQSVTFQTNGNVGIANSSPSNTLDVTGTARITTSITTGAVYATNSTVTNAVATTSSAGTAVATTYTGGSMSLSGNLTIAGTFTIENISAGSTLTATNANATTLTAATLLNTNMISTNITTATLNASTGITTSSAQITNSNVTTETVGTARITTNLLAVGNSNTVGSIFTTGGNVGIGTVFPVAPLHVVGTTSATSTTAGGIFMGTLTDNNTFIKLNSTTGSYIDFSGNNNDYRGRILYNNASDYMDFSTNTTSVARMDSVGNLTMTGDITAFGSLSDRRLKENIMNIPSDIALDKVKSLRPVTFNWRDDIFNESARGQSDVGFIAQEVESIIPYAVSNYSEINSGEMYKRIKHERIIPYLIAAVQTLDIERSRQNLEIERLTNIIHLLNERLANIEQQYQI